ncbi:MAG: putative toxin-antitoxin system toxin component, PIN family [Nitrospirales bacterium]|nr:MAG: putative toxin-antitoxin system toxin component, PIN family [Nitrospirales bacterium]
MKLALDTNVLIAAFIAHRTCYDVLEHSIRQHELIASTLIFDEVRSTLLKNFHYTRQETTDVITLLKAGIVAVDPHPLKTSICRDPDDDIILATAITGACQCIVTGDHDLLEFTTYQGIDILLPNAYWRYEQESGSLS